MFVLKWFPGGLFTNWNLFFGTINYVVNNAIGFKSFLHWKYWRVITNRLFFRCCDALLIAKIIITVKDLNQKLLAKYIIFSLLIIRKILDSKLYGLQKFHEKTGGQKEVPFGLWKLLRENVISEQSKSKKTESENPTLKQGAYPHIR